jgi:hypothetical protein
LVKKPRPPRNKQKAKAAKAKLPEILLFDLGNDVGERHNLAEANPEIVDRLRARMEELDAEITKNARSPWVKE